MQIRIKKICQFGGIACYVKDAIAVHIFQVKYELSHLSFRIDTCSSFMFIGVYTQPEGARHFHESMFSVLAKAIIACNEKGLVPIIGGDFNSRPGNSESLGNGNWKYEMNKDVNVHRHGRTLLRDLCSSSNVKPVNGLIYDKREFHDDFTFLRGCAKSQIDQ